MSGESTNSVVVHSQSKSGCADWTLRELGPEGWVTRCGQEPPRVLDVPGIILEQETPNSPYGLVDFQTAEDFKQKPIAKAGEVSAKFSGNTVKSKAVGMIPQMASQFGPVRMNRPRVVPQ